MDENVQRKMMELESYKSQMQQYQQQKSQVMMSVQELLSAKATIDSMKNAKKGTEMIIPIGGGTFIKGIIENPKAVIASIGADIAVTKDLLSAIKHIDEQVKSAEKGILKMDDEIHNIETKAQKIYMEIETAVAKEKN
ncbi:MAG: prefoldin subunit alpha [archaeon]